MVYLALYVVLAVVGLIMLLAGALGMIGTFIPKQHAATVSFELPISAPRAWAIIDDPSSYPQWLAMAEQVEMLPERNGNVVFRQSQGRNSFILEETLKEPGRRVVRTIADDNKLFGGSWDHVVEPLAESRARVTITESGEIYAAIPRAMMRLFFGYDHTLRQYQKDLIAHVNKAGA